MAMAVCGSSFDWGRYCETFPASSWCKKLFSMTNISRFPVKGANVVPRKIIRTMATTMSSTVTGDWKEQAEIIASTLDSEGLEQASRLIISSDESLNLNSGLSPVYVGGIIKRSKRPGAALEIFSWARQQHGYRHDVYSYNCALAALVIDKTGEKGSREMQELLKLMETEGLEPDDDTYNLLVKGLCRNGEIDMAWSLLQEMILKGRNADSLTCGNLVEKFCGAKRISDACHIFQELENHGVSIGMLAYNAILRTILSSGDLDGGFKFSGKVVEGGNLPHILAYKTILDCLIRTGRTREASEVVGDMIKSSLPDVTTYTALITVLCKHNRSDDAMRVFDMMLGTGIRPGAEVYTALLVTHCRRRKMDGAYKLFVEMVDQGCPPNSSSYGLFIRCLCNGGKFHIAYDIHRSMVSRGAPLPDESTYMSLVSAACTIGQTDRARQLFEEATSCLTSLGESSLHNVLVEGLCKTGKVEEAFDFIARMVERGWVPNIQTYTALVMGFFRVSQPTRAEELFSAMKQRGYVPNAGIYSTLVTGLCKCGKVEAARNAFVEAMEAGTVPDSVSYNVLVRGLISIGRENEAAELYHYMSDRGYAADRSTRSLFESV